jgi:hypothetical protein
MYHTKKSPHQIENATYQFKFKEYQATTAFCFTALTKECCSMLFSFLSLQANNLLA